jgi:hypothetical protein
MIYSGRRTIQELHEKAEFLEITGYEWASP